MKINYKIKYLLVLAAIAAAVNLIFDPSAALECIPIFVGIILCDRITQQLYRQGKCFVAAELVFAAVYAFYTCLCVADRFIPQVVIILFILTAFWGITLKKQIYSDGEYKLSLSFPALQQRNFILFLLFSVNKSILDNIFLVFCIASLLFFIYDHFMTKFEYRPLNTSKGISNQLIVLADIRDFSSMPGLAKKASLISYPRLNYIFKRKLPNNYKCTAINYGQYLRAKSVYDTIWKKRLVICCDSFELFANDAEEVLCNIVDGFKNNSFEVSFVVKAVSRSVNVKKYRSIVNSLENIALFIEGKDIPMNMELTDFLSGNTSCDEMIEDKTQGLYNREYASPVIIGDPGSKFNTSYKTIRAQENDDIKGTDTSFSRKKSERMRSTSKVFVPAQVLSYLGALLTRAPWSDLLINFVFSLLGKKRNSWMYGAVKSYYDKHQILVLVIAFILNFITFGFFILDAQNYIALTSGGAYNFDMVEPIYFFINPIENIVIAAVYLSIMRVVSGKSVEGSNKFRKLIINMDISDLMKISYKAIPSYNSDLKKLSLSGNEYMKLQNDVLSVSYSYFRQYEKMLSQITDKSVIIHADNDFRYYGSIKGFDLCREVDILKMQEMKVYIHTDFPESYPNLSSCVIIGGGYFECIKAVMMSADNASSETLDLVNSYCSLLFAAAENKLDLSSQEHRTLYYQIEQLKQHYSMIEIFYEFMQTAELFMHYASLCVIADSDDIAADFSELSLGKMAEFISREKRLFSPSIYGIQASETEKGKQIRTEMQKAADFFSNEIGINITTKRSLFRYTFDLTVQIRNRYLGHGALAYYVSEDMLRAFIPLVSAAIAECIAIISSQKSSGRLCRSKLNGTDYPLALVYMRNMYFYSKKVENNGIEYINPITGSFYRTYNTEPILLKWNENVREAESR